MEKITSHAHENNQSCSLVFLEVLIGVPCICSSSFMSELWMDSGCPPADHLPPRCQHTARFVRLRARWDPAAWSDWRVSDSSLHPIFQENKTQMCRKDGTPAQNTDSFKEVQLLCKCFSLSGPIYTNRLNRSIQVHSVGLNLTDFRVNLEIIRKLKDLDWYQTLQGNM